MKPTKRIDGVIGASVGFDWITLDFEGYSITIDKLNVSNQPYESLKKSIKEPETAVQPGTLVRQPDPIRDDCDVFMAPGQFTCQCGPGTCESKGIKDGRDTE